MTALDLFDHRETPWWRLRRAAGGLLFTLVPALSSACGHYGVDLDGVSDASVDPGRDAGKSSSTGKEPKPDTATTASDDTSTTVGSASGKSDEPKSSAPADAGSGGETYGTHDAATTATATREPETSSDAEAPRHEDASVDQTAHSDAGAPHDASMTSTAAEDPDAGPADDAGSTVCDPDCACVEGGQCDLVCLTQECVIGCEAKSVCDVIVGASSSVEIDCAQAAVCTALDVVADALDVTCSGEGKCHTQCSGEQDCTVECKGSGLCVTECLDSATCNVTCKEGADCYVLYDNRDNVDLNCESGELTQCATAVTCGSPCP